MKRLVIYPGFMSAEEPQYFKKELGALLVYRDRNYQPRRGDFIIGWGNSRPPIWQSRAWQANCHVLNHWTAIANAVDKLRALIILHDELVSTVPFTVNVPQALAWRNAGHTVMCRTELRGMKGAGIYVAHGTRSLPDAPLYTKFIPDCQEFRVHVFKDSVLCAQEKRKSREERNDPYVRSEENGWVFCRKNVRVPYQTTAVAVRAVKALGLDFGGVDMLYSPSRDESYVLEVNTAPGIGVGISGYGREEYVEAFKKAFAAA